MHRLAVDGPESGAGHPATAIGQVEVVEDLPTGLPWPVDQVPACGLEYIEDEEGNGVAVGVVASAMDAGGQQVEVGPAVRGEHYDLAIEHDITDRRQAGLELGEPVDPFTPSPGPKTDPRRLHLG
jgi:hypothetical protein